MFRRPFLLLPVVVMLLTAACAQSGSISGSPDPLPGNAAVSTYVAATVSAVVPTSVAATLRAADPTQAMAAAMNELSGEELATHMALMEEIEAAGTPTPFFTPTPFPTFTPLPTRAEVLNVPTATPACTNLAEFVKNLTINDNTAIKGGEGFAKIWRVKNAGTCTWTTAYALVFVAGEPLSGPDRVTLPGEVTPGQTVDLRVNLVAPHTPGFFTASWMLQDTGGSRFGLDTDGSQPLSLTIEVKPHVMTGHSHH